MSNHHQQHLTSSHLSSSSNSRPETYQSRIVNQSRLDNFHEKGYHKRFLGQDLDVVCFLLATEVERLYEDGHMWKSKYEQLQSQNLDRMHYDTHIAELTDKLNETETKNMALYDENQRLVSELRNWEQRYVTGMQAKDREIEELKRRIAEMQNEINQQKVVIMQNGDLQNKIDALERELQNWRNIATERGEKCSLLQTENDKLTHTCRHQEETIHSLEHRCGDYQKQIQDLLARIRALEEELEGHTHEIRKHAGHKANLEQENKRLLSELEDLRSRYNDLLSRYNELLPYPEKCKKLEERVVLQEAQISNLHQQLEDKNGQIKDWSERYTKLEIQLAHYKQLEDKLREYENRITMLSQEVERLNNLLSQKVKECDENAHKAAHYEGECQSLARRNELLAKEIEDLKRFLGQKQKEIDDLKAEYSNLLSAHRKLEQTNQESENKIVMLTSEIERLNTLIKNHLQQIDNLKQENYKLIQELQSWKAKEGHIIDLENKVVMLAQELENLRRALGEKSGECEDWKQKFYKSDASCRQLEERVKDLENRATVLATEVERQSHMLQSKDQEISKLRQTIYELENTIKRLEGDISSHKHSITVLETNIQKLSEEVSSWKSRCLELQNRVNEYKTIEIELATLNEEIERLMKEKADLERLNQQLQQHYIAKNALEEKVGDLTVQCVLLFAEIEALRMRVRDKEREVDEVRRSSLQPIKKSVQMRVSNMTSTVTTTHQH